MTRALFEAYVTGCVMAMTAAFAALLGGTSVDPLILGVAGFGAYLAGRWERRVAGRMSDRRGHRGDARRAPG